MSGQNGDEIDIQHFFRCRAVSVDPSLRTGPELTDPGRVGYQLVRVLPDQLATIDVKPTELRTFLAANVEALVLEAALLG